MSQKRKAKDERKEVQIEKRVEMLEMEIGKHNPMTYNFLVEQIRKHSSHAQQYIKVIEEVNEFMEENHLQEQFKVWHDGRVEKMAAEKKKLESADKPVCATCENRGYIGDDEECPACHPNKK